MRKPKIYLAGPMTGIPDHNFPLFNERAAVWRDAGWDVRNPAELFGGYTAGEWGTYVGFGVAEVDRCDAIALLPGYENSAGAMVEYLTARLRHKEIHDAMEVVTAKEVAA